jgi:16S rRNA (guanine527-N7)-methyltransferase
MRDQLLSLLSEKLSEADINISAPIQNKIVDFLLLLIKWNQTYNLTSIRYPEKMITHHVLDSLSIAKLLEGNQILDVGTGAGFPGIPLALTEPSRSFVLIDSNGKKIRFLLHVIQQLQIPNVMLVQERVESYKSSHQFTTIISRAFSSIKDFIEQTKHLCSKDCKFLAMKGEYPLAELADLPNGFSVKAIDVIEIKGLEAKRHAVSLQRTEIVNA